jgi:hypothetical protein
MSRTKTKKTFDCIAFKEKAQAEIYEETRNLSRAEQIEYFKRTAAAGPLGKLRKKLPRIGTP